MTPQLRGSGSVAKHVGLPRSRFLYLVEKGDLPGPSHEVPGRRLFSTEDVQRICDELAARPELLRSDGSTEGDRLESDVDPNSGDLAR